MRIVLSIVGRRGEVFYVGVFELEGYGLLFGLRVVEGFGVGD